MKSLNLDIVTPDGVVFSGQVDKVLVPATTGQLGILPRHSSLFATLTEGELIISQDAKLKSISIGGGFIQVAQAQTTILVSRAKDAASLNEQETREALNRAKEVLAQKPTGQDHMIATNLMRQALTDLKIIRRLHSHRAV